VRTFLSFAGLEKYEKLQYSSRKQHRRENCRFFSDVRKRLAAWRSDYLPVLAPHRVAYATNEPNRTERMNATRYVWCPPRRRCLDQRRKVRTTGGRIRAGLCDWERYEEREMRVPRRGKTKGAWKRGEGKKTRTPETKRKGSVTYRKRIRKGRRGGDGRTDFVAEKIPSFRRKENKERYLKGRSFFFFWAAGGPPS